MLEKEGTNIKLYPTLKNNNEGKAGKTTNNKMNNSKQQQ